LFIQNDKKKEKIEQVKIKHESRKDEKKNMYKRE